jgi:competence protein ComEC
MPEAEELNPDDLLSVHFINVGEGDAILIMQGDYAMLVDGGSPEMGTTAFSYLRDQGITTLEYVVATHPFSDHTGGLPEVAVPFAGHTFNLGDAALTVLSPDSADQWENRANYSIVLRVEFGATSFLLMGDAMREVEAILLDGTTQLSADVIKIARHGASSATTSGFLDAVNPSIAVISAGEGNSFLPLTLSG